MDAPLDAAALVTRFQKEIWCYLRVLGCEPAQADDLTQETFLAVLRKPFEQYNEKATAAYLRTVARNLFLMAVRKKKARPAFVDIDAVEPGWIALTRDRGGAWTDALELCLQRLPERTRAMLRLRFHDRMASKEIGAELGLKPPHVDTVIHRAKGVLKQCIGERLEEDERRARGAHARGLARGHPRRRGR